MKGIGGFYYVATAEGLVECKAKGIFRKKGISPLPGDLVRLEQEDNSAVIAEILPRKNMLVRPPMANLDILFIVAATTEPAPNYLVLDKMCAIAVDKGITPVIVATKTDLCGERELRETYAAVLSEDKDGDIYPLVKAADKLSAYIKCIEERKAGNNEFLSAEAQTRAALDASPLPEVQYFLEHFIPAFERDLDELGAIGQ